MAKTFVASSSLRMDALDTTYGNWASATARSHKFLWYPTANTTGTIWSRMDVTTLLGWDILTIAGSAAPKLQFEIINSGNTERLAVRTTAEFALNTWHTVGISYNGTKTPGGVLIRVDGSNQTTTTIANTLANSPTVGSGPMQIGARFGTSSPGTFLDGTLQRVCAWTSVLSSANLDDATYVTGADLWLELSDLGATMQPDWSGNSRTFTINFTQAYLAGGVGDLAPNLGTTGVITLSGPLSRFASNPVMYNLGYLGSGVADQIGPGWADVICHNKLYRTWQDNDTGGTTLDVGNQMGGPLDGDAPTIPGTSTNGTSWTFTDQNNPGTTNVISVNTLGGDATFKAAAKGETDFRHMIRDRTDGSWRFYGHCGNNSGPRQMYQLKCAAGLNPWVAANWSVYPAGTGRPIILIGTTGADDDFSVSDAHVFQLPNNSWMMIYWATKADSQVTCLLATSPDGDVWTKQGRAIALGASGTWDSASVYPLGFTYDAPTGYYIFWYCGSKTKGNNDAIGFAYTLTPTVIPYTKGIYNPVLCKQNNTIGSTNFERLIATSGQLYLDMNRYRLIIREDNGVSGTPGFRGRGEVYYDRIIKNQPSGLFI